MLIFSENFDQIEEFADMEELFGYTFLSANDSGYTEQLIGPFVGAEDDFVDTDLTNPMKLGDRDSRSLYLPTADILMLPELKPSRRIILGLSMGSGGMRTGAEIDGTYYYSTAFFIPPFYFKVGLGNGLDGNTYMPLLFEIEVSFNENSIDISFDNQNESLSNPSTESGIPFNRFRKNFLEFYVDSDGVVGSAGSLKIAINGRTVLTRDNVITSDYEAWSSNPANEGSYFDTVRLEWHVFNNERSDVVVDSMYVCNEDGGVHDDFLGPVHISTFYPDPDNVGDKTNWVGFKDQVITTDPHASLVNTSAIDFTDEDVDYIEAETDNEEELFYMKNNLDPDRIGLNNPIAINFRTFVKDVFGYGEDSFDKSLMVITKPSGNSITQEISSQIDVDQFTYKPLDVYFDVVPNLAVPWTWALVDETQFGIESAPIT